MIMRKEYQKPQAEIKAFVTEDVITLSGTGAPSTLKTEGANLGTIKASRLAN